MKKLLFLILVLLCFCIFSQEEIPEEYDLKYIYKKDETTNYILTIENFEKLKVQGQSTEKRTKIIINFNEEIKNVDENGNGIIKMKYMDGSYNNFKIDISGKEAILKRNQKGHILESEGFQEISQEFFKIIQKKIAEYVPGFDRLPVKIDFSNYDSNLFNQYFESFTPVFEDKKVKIGDTWEKEILVPLIYLKGKMVYTLEKVEENKAYINLSLNRKDIKGSGNLIFDIEKGKLIEENFTIKGENINTKLDFGKYTNLKQVYEITGTVTIKINLKQL